MLILDDVMNYLIVQFEQCYRLFLFWSVIADPQFPFLTPRVCTAVLGSIAPCMCLTFVGVVIQTFLCVRLTCKLQQDEKERKEREAEEAARKEKDAAEKKDGEEDEEEEEGEGKVGVIGASEGYLTCLMCDGLKA